MRNVCTLPGPAVTPQGSALGMGEADQKTPKIPSSLNDHTELPDRPPSQPSPPLLQQGEIHTAPETLCCLQHILLVPNPPPFPILVWISRRNGSCSPGMLLPVKQGSHARGVASCSLAFSLIRLLYSSLSMMAMSKAAAAIRGDCTQHPSQICIFPSRSTPCHVCLNYRAGL